MIGIYKITNPIGQVYIGQSKILRKRISSHKYFFQKNGAKWGKLYLCFENYGFENHIIEIIEECSMEDLDKRELFYQEKYNSVVNGLNSVLNKGCKGKNKYSEISKLKMSSSAKNKIFTDIHKKNMSLTRQGKDNGNSKIVLDIVNGIFYETMKEVKIINKFNHSVFSKMLNNRIKNTTNYKFV